MRALLIVIILVLAFRVHAAEVEPAPAKEEIVVASKTYPVGKTENGTFVVPDTNTGVYEISIPCDPQAHIKIELLDDANELLGAFTRKPGVCANPTVWAKFTRKDGDNKLVSIPQGKSLRTVVEAVENPVNTEITVALDKSQ